MTREHKTSTKNGKLSVIEIISSITSGHLNVMGFKLNSREISILKLQSLACDLPPQRQPVEKSKRKKSVKVNYF